MADEEQVKLFSAEEAGVGSMQVALAWFSRGGFLSARLALLMLVILWFGEAAFAAPEAADGDKSLPVYESWSRAVIRLEHRDVIHREGQAVPTEVDRPNGTAFFVRFGGSGFVVSARHVVEVPYDLRARVLTDVIADDKTELLELRLPREAWVFHPQGEKIREIGPNVAAVDVAVAKVPGIRERRFTLVPHCPPCPEDWESQFAEEDPIPPGEVLVVGFPVDLGFKLAEQRPMARQGVIALVAGDRFLTVGDAYKDERSVVVDVPLFPGNSGSPVFSKSVGGRLRLVGLVSATNERLSFGVVEPVSRIIEALELALEKKAPDSPTWHLLEP